MKVAVISDIHGNLPALMAALKVIEKENCDYIYNTGDTIGFGPYPNECLEIVVNTKNMINLMGNHEEYLYKLPIDAKDIELKHHLWTDSNIDADFKKKILEFPYVIYSNFQGIDICFLHYGFSNEKNKFSNTILTPNKVDLDKLFDNINCDIVFYGHNHKYSDIQGKKRYICLGSLGCNINNIARVTILKCEDNEYEIKYIDVNYDKSKLFDAFERRNVPGKDYLVKWFFGKDIIYK